MTASELFNSIQILRKHSNERELPAQLVASFLFIASQGDCKQADVSEATGCSKSATSRNIYWLGPVNKLKRRSGLRWVAIYEDPENYKANRVKLTALGRQIIQELQSA